MSNQAHDFVEPTVESMAREYVDVISGPADGLGRHKHPKYGASHSMMIFMAARFGMDETDAAIKAEFVNRKRENGL